MIFSNQMAYDEDMDVNNYMAIERTIMANDRTLLSFLRTSLYFSVAALTIPTLIDLKKEWLAIVILWISAAITFITGIWKYFSMRRKINNSREYIRQLGKKDI